MYVFVQKREISNYSLVRYFGRAASVIVFVGWIASVVLEWTRSGAPVAATYYQASCLAVVFLGYAVGWRQELLGGFLAVVGTIAFIALNSMTVNMAFSGAVWFAAPGLCFLAAHCLETRVQRKSSSP